MAASSLGCDTAKKGDLPSTGPAPTLVGTSFDAFTKNADGSYSGVPVQGRFVLRFSRPLAPSSSARTNLSISSLNVPSVDFAEERVDPLERAIVFVLKVPLHVDETYHLKIHPSADPRSTLAAFDGAPFEGTVDITFHTKATVDPAAPIDVAVNPCTVVEDIFATTCAGVCCHGSGDTNPGTAGAMGLNLLADSMVRATAIGHAAVEVQDESSPNGPGSLQPRNFPYGMPIVSPGHSAASYLMYKVLLNAPNAARGSLKEVSLDPSVGDPVDGDLGGFFFRELRSRMVGTGMPEPYLKTTPRPGLVCSQSFVDHPPAAGLTWKEIQRIRQWIDQGAESCPCGDDTVPKSVKDANPLCKPTVAPGDAGPDGSPDAADTGTGDARSDAGADVGDADAPG